MNKENMTAKEFLQVLSGICKTNRKIEDWSDKSPKQILRLGEGGTRDNQPLFEEDVYLHKAVTL